jgi:hypothetical protein
MLNKTLAIGVGLVSLVGCMGFDEAAAPPVADAADELGLYQRLGTRETLSLDVGSDVGVMARDDRGNDLPCLQPTVLGGEAVLRSTETELLLVEDLEIQLSDVSVRPGVVYDESIDLTDVHLRLGTQIVIEPEWSVDGQSAEGIGYADLLLDWALLTHTGHIHPLATQRIRDAEFFVRARLDEHGNIRAEAISLINGPIWDFGVIEVSDMTLDVQATATRDGVDYL